MISLFATKNKNSDDNFNQARKTLAEKHLACSAHFAGVLEAWVTVEWGAAGCHTTRSKYPQIFGLEIPFTRKFPSVSPGFFVAFLRYL